MVNDFLSSRRQGLSPFTVIFYHRCLSKAIGIELTPQGINDFLSSLTCNNGKHSYFRVLRVLCNWLTRNDLIESNPLKKVDPPKIQKRILPSFTESELNNLLCKIDNPRDKAIISLFADSGMRLNELANIRPNDIDWNTYTINIWGKGNKQRRAPFTERTGILLKECLPYSNNNLWNMTRRGIQSMLNDYRERLNLPITAHTFRRTFASNLHRKGVDIEHIMRLGGWETLEMVLRYTRSVKFDDSLSLYQAAMK